MATASAEGIRLPPALRLPKAVQGLAFLLARRRPVAALARRHGNTFTLDLPGFGRTVVIGDPDQIKELFGASRELLGRSALNLGKVFGPGSMFNLSGEEHLNRRRLLGSSQRKVRTGVGLRQADPSLHLWIGEPTATSLWRQFSTVARRQVRLTVADRGYFIFLAVVPFVVGVLALVVPGNVGFGPADPQGKTPNEPTQLLILINISAVFMGTALTVRDLVGERAIFRREQAAGLSASAYLAAKILVFSVAAAIQAAILATIVVIGKGGPTQGAVLLGNSSIELYLTLAGTAVVSAIAGLALSSLARSPEQILPMVVVVIMMSMVFCNGLIQINGRLVLDQISWLLPGRWGFAASASTVDLMTVSPLLPIEDTLWTHKGGWWVFDMAMLVVLAVAFTGLVRYRLRLPTHDPRQADGAGATRRDRLSAALPFRR